MFEVFRFRFENWLRKNRVDIFRKRAEEMKVFGIMAKMKLEEERYKHDFVDSCRNAFDGLQHKIPCNYGEDRRKHGQKLWCHHVILQIADDIRNGKVIVGESEKKSSAKGTE